MKKNTKSDMLAFYVIVLLITACVSVLPKWEKNENKPENLLDTSTKEYMETVACIVGLSYSGDEMFQHKNVSTTRFPYMNFEIICKHETEETFKKEARKVAEKVFYSLKLFEYETPIWKYTHELVSLKFESEKRDKYTSVLEYSDSYSFDVNELKKYDTFEEYFSYRKDI